MGDWAVIITPKKGMGAWKAENLNLRLDVQPCGGNGCQQAGEQEDRLDCQGDSWITSTGPVGTWEMFQEPSCRTKALWMECEEPTLDTGGAEHARGAGRAWGGWVRGTSVGGIFLFVAWWDFVGGLFLNSCLGKMSKFL